MISPKLNASPRLRQYLYWISGGQRDYVDVGHKARACVDHDRRCAEIMRGRVKLSPAQS